MMKKVAAEGGPSSPNRDRLYHDNYGYFDDKTFFLYEAAPASAGEGPPTLNRGPHPC